MSAADDEDPVEQTRTTMPASSRWATSVVLGDGTSAFIRPLVPSDQAELAAFHERQSSESVYRRYFSPKPTLTERELEHFTTVDMVDRVALAVEVHDEFVGWSSYERWTGRDEAEAAFMVDDEHHGRGIATLMLEHLAAIARTNGIARFTAEVLSDNRGMLAVFAKAGWPVHRRFESGVVDLDWELATTTEFIDTVERREQRADSRAIARLLHPRAVAVIGASDRAGSVGKILWDNIRGSVTAPVYPVNPRIEDLDGRRCFGSVADLPEEVSLAIVAVPARQLDSTIDACIQKRMRGAVIITSIDTNDTGAQVEVDALVSRARRNGLRLIGPSSLGVASLHGESELQAALIDVTLPAGGVAVSMQSGSLGGSLLRRARDLELGLSWFVSLGDKSDVSANDLLQFWEDDQRTKVIGLYTESFGNPKKFARIARRVSRSIPIVAVRTAAAATGHLGEALYQQTGLIEVPSVPALLDTCRVLEAQPILRGRRVCIVSNSVSPAALARTALEQHGLDAKEDEPPDARQLNWRATPDDYAAAVERAMARPDVDGLLVIFAPPLPAEQAAMGPTIAAAARGCSKPVVAVMIGSGDGPVAPEATVPGFSFPEQAVAALARSHEYGRWLATEGAVAAAESRPVDPARAAELISSALAEHSSGDHEAPVDLGIERSTALLGTYGITVAPAATSTVADAPDVAAELGFPVALKAAGRRQGRSAEAGIALDLPDRSAVDAAARTMARSLGSGADALVVQRMTAPGIGLRVRCQRDPRLGIIVEVGYGGVDAELIDDTSSRLAPVSPASAAAMLTETRVGRGVTDAAVDSSPIVNVIVQAAQLAADHPNIDRIDLNPVILSIDHAIATDVSLSLLAQPPDEGPIRKLE